MNWTKQGLAFKNFKSGKYNDNWTKSGAIVTEFVGGKQVAKQINGKYWMYFGDTNLFIAQSDDLINWEPLETDTGEELKIVLKTRVGKFDSNLVESGPPALYTEHGILLIYNGMNSILNGDPLLGPGTYATGEALFDKNDPSTVLDRTDSYLLYPDKSYELEGQVNRVCFVEGMAYFQNKIFLYYGTADSRLAVAIASADALITKIQIS